MPFSLKIKSSALKELRKIDMPYRLQIISAIDKLVGNPYVGKALKGELSGLRRIRVSSYRVIYEISEGEVLILVLHVSHKKNIYR